MTYRCEEEGSELCRSAVMKGERDWSRGERENNYIKGLKVLMVL